MTTLSHYDYTLESRTPHWKQQMTQQMKTNEVFRNEKVRWLSKEKTDCSVRWKVCHIVHVKWMRQNDEWGQQMKKTDEVTEWIRWCGEKMNRVNGKVHEVDMYNRKCTSLHTNLHQQWHKMMNKARWKVHESVNGKRKRWKGEMMGKMDEVMWTVCDNKVGWSAYGIGPCEALAAAPYQQDLPCASSCLASCAAWPWSIILGSLSVTSIKIKHRGIVI